MISCNYSIGNPIGIYLLPIMKSVDARRNIKINRKKKKINPFRKLKRSLTGFKTELGFDVLFIDNDNKIIGNKIVLK